VNSASTEKLSLFALTAMVIGSMVGAGIFSLPRTFAVATGPFGALVAWSIAGIGMLALAMVFRTLAVRRPDLDAGIFAYAKAGFGDYAGFLSAFGYWLVACIADVSYWVLIKSTLGAFFPIFGDGNTIAAVLVSSIGLWLFHFMVLRGIRSAAAVNTIVTVAKVVPILVFIAILVAMFRADLFRSNFWGGNEMRDVGLLEQVSATMLVTVFVFIGIEGASVYSRYARRRSDVGLATIVGFFAVTALMVLVTVLPYAVLERGDIAAMRQPSMAAVLEAVVGPWGGIFVSIGLIVSVLGAYLAWSLIGIEVMFAAARSGDMPRFLATRNSGGVPAAALWLTNAVIQLFLISTLFSQDAFALMVKLTGSMVLVPYLLVAAYGLHTACRSENPDNRLNGRNLDLIAGAVATLYAAFMIYAGGIKFLLLSAVLYAPGTALYFQVRRERKLPLFTPIEWLVFAVISLGCIVGVYGVATGKIAI
jgi:arginine:ornithine antiporter/lysine permease